ncbi:hypothetical protein [Bacillus toyonensis]|uniref:hypothetical protein n=1 Tax=Bacillus toyonensis TaxID=155322 RepID=UPI00115DE523|nr:hypothetical protein [Bacillus toyonensis]
MKEFVSKVEKLIDAHKANQFFGEQLVKITNGSTVNANAVNEISGEMIKNEKKIQRLMKELDNDVSRVTGEYGLWK